MMKVVNRKNARWALISGLSLVVLVMMVFPVMADPTWEAGINISSTDASLLPVDLAVGVDPAGLDGVDSLDVIAPPAPPGPPYLYAYFIAGTTKLFTDIRPDVEESITWRGVIWNSEVETFYVTWDASELPATGTFYFDGAIDMRTTGSATVTGTWNDIDLRYQYVFTITQSFEQVLTTLVVDPASAELVCQDTQQFTAAGTDQFGDPMTITPTWTVTPEGLGMVDGSGFFTATGTGAGLVIASVGDIADSAEVTVGMGSLAIVMIYPEMVTVACLNQQQFTATGYDACDNLVEITPVWSVSNSLIGSVDANGLFTANHAGIGYVIVSVGDIADSARVTVTAGEVAAISVTPEADTIFTGEQGQFTVTGYDDCSNPADFNATWSVSPVGLGTIDAGGLFTAGDPGSGWVFAEVSPAFFRMSQCDAPYLKASDVTACDGEAVMVSVDVAESIEPIDAFSIEITYDTAHMTYTGSSVDGNLVDGWTIFAAPEVSPGLIRAGGFNTVPVATGTSGTLFTLNFNVLGAEGDASMISLAGTADDLDAGYNLCAGEYECPEPPIVDSAFVVVLPKTATGFMIEPDGVILQAGESYAFAGTATDGGFEWDVTDETTFETDDPQGSMAANVYTAGQAGTWMVIATYEEFADTAEVTVEAGEASSVVIDMESAEVTFGGEVCFEVMGYDSYGNPTPITPIWTLSDSLLGTIDEFGCFTADSVEVSGYIYASVDGIVDSVFVEVIGRGDPIAITIHPQDTTVASSQTVTYMVWATDGHTTWDVTDLCTFDATDSCCVWYTNIYQACFAGTWAVMANMGQLADTAIVHVTIGNIVGIEITPEAATLVSGGSQAYVAGGFDENGNDTDLTAATTFATTDPNGSFVDNVYTAYEIGQWEITGTYLTFEDMVTVTVAAFTVQLELAGGWNMVSLPVVPEDFNVNALFPENVGFYAWNGDDYVTADVMEIGTGYWLALLEPQMVELSGIPVMTYTTDIMAGWNMVGSIASATTVGAFEDTPDEIILPDAVNWYDPAQRIYVVTEDIEPGKGYWLPSLTAGTLTLNEAAAAKAISGHQEMLPLASIRVTAGDLAKTLEFGFAAGATDGFDKGLDRPLPPASPYGRDFAAGFTADHSMFDRCSRDVRGTGSASWKLEVPAQAGITMQWDVTALSPDLDVVLVADGQRIDMRASQSFVLKRGGLVQISAGKGLLAPADFSLLQNYPNPFNPSTDIRYQVSGASHTMLRVFNVLGQEVATLVDEMKEPGYYTATWDASEMASGIYFYQLQAGDFSATRKMVLTK